MRLLILCACFAFQTDTITTNRISEGTHVFWYIALGFTAFFFVVDVLSLIAYYIRNPRILLFAYCIDPVAIISLASLGIW